MDIQKQEIKEAVELPLVQGDLYEQVGQGGASCASSLCSLLLFVHPLGGVQGEPYGQVGGAAPLLLLLRPVPSSPSSLTHLFPSLWWLPGVPLPVWYPRQPPKRRKKMRQGRRREEYTHVGRGQAGLWFAARPCAGCRCAGCEAAA